MGTLTYFHCHLWLLERQSICKTYGWVAWLHDYPEYAPISPIMLMEPDRRMIGRNHSSTIDFSGPIQWGPPNLDPKVSARLKGIHFQFPVRSFIALVTFKEHSSTELARYLHSMCFCLALRYGLFRPDTPSSWCFAVHPSCGPMGMYRHTWPCSFHTYFLIFPGTNAFHLFFSLNVLHLSRTVVQSLQVNFLLILCYCQILVVGYGCILYNVIVIFRHFPIPAHRWNTMPLCKKSFSPDQTI